MRKESPFKHEKPFPSARDVKRTCQKELYRTVKKLNQWIAPDKIKQAENFYFKEVILHLQWIVEHRDNRKKQADWWCEHISPKLAELWGVDQHKLNKAFRDSYGG